MGLEIPSWRERKLQKSPDIQDFDTIKVYFLEQDQYFDLKALVKYSCIGKSKLDEYRKAGCFPGYRIGGKWLFRKSEIDSWIKKHRQEPPKDLKGLVDSVLNGA